MLTSPTIRWLIALACCGLLLSGCRSAPDGAQADGAAAAAPGDRGERSAAPDAASIEPTTSQPATRTLGWFAYGASVEGRPLLAWAGEGAPLPASNAGERRVVLLLASIHGSEGAGTPLLERLVTALEDEERALLEGRRVVVVPIANPDGLWRRARHNARGVDLNRNFPAANFRERARHGEGPLSEPEARALHGLIEAERPAVLVSVHQPLACVDWDGGDEAAALAGSMAAACELPARRLGGRAGSLGSWTGGTLGVPAVTLELRRGDERAELGALWERYGEALRVAVRWSGRG